MAPKERSMNRKEVQAALGELMALQDWSQVELARQLDASESAVCRWVKGERLPSATTRKFIRNLLAQARSEAKQPA